MKTLQKAIVLLAISILPSMALASMSIPADLDDTIPAAPRCDKYYYTKWFDDCSNYFPNGGVVDSCFCRYPQIHCFYGSPVAKWERAKGRMRVDGLVAMVDRYTAPDAVDSGYKLPEYLYLYQLVGRHYVFLQSLGIEDGLDLVLLDSVRWDTATARVMELKRGWNGEYTQYCYLYEAYFENPVYVDTDFYIFGSSNSNYPGSGADSMVHTIYTDIMDYSDYALRDGCNPDKYATLIQSECKPQGGYVGIVDMQHPEWGWYTPWPDSPWGYYLAIIEQWNLNAVPDSPQHGEVIGGGRWPDDSYDTIEAIPAPGYYFVSWNDGNTDNPRVVHLTSDTSFVAIFDGNGIFNLQVFSSNEMRGTVTGGGSYLGGMDITITALPISDEYKFSHWNDGNTDNPRVVHLVSDTTFVAYFAEKEYYNVETASNNEEWGSVDGGGIYMEGSEATLTVTTEPFCLFEGWADGDMQMPRIVTVTQDTLFTANFSFDSAWAASINMVGDLDFSVSPNPTTGRLTIICGKMPTGTSAYPGNAAPPFELSLFDMNGKLIMDETLREVGNHEVDLSTLPSGQYLLVLRAKESYGIRTIVKK